MRLSRIPWILSQRVELHARYQLPYVLALEIDFRGSAGNRPTEVAFHLMLGQNPKLAGRSNFSSGGSSKTLYAVKTQIWIVISRYLMVAILTRTLRVDQIMSRMLQVISVNMKSHTRAVSYTHLTLPTNREV